MGAAIRAHDWSCSPLGVQTSWPAALHNALSLMLDSPESMYIVWGPSLTFFFNDAYRPILGPRVDGALGQPFPVLWADAWEAVRTPFEKALDGEATRFVDLPITMARRGMEEQTWWSFSFSPLRDDAGEVRGVLCITRETTAQIKAAEALRESEKHLDALIRSSSEVRYSVSADWSHLNQLAGGDFIADTTTANAGWLCKYIPPEDHAAVITEFERAIRTRSTYHLEHRVNLVEGGVGWVMSRAVPLFDAEDRITAWLGAASDITVKKKAEATLNELNEMLERKVAQRSAELERVWSNAQDLHVVIDKAGVFRAVSPSATRLLGWSPEKMVGRSLFEFTVPEGHEASRDALCQASQEPLPSHTNRYLHKDGTQRWISWITTPEGGLIYCYGRDVTLETQQAAILLQTEEALRQSQKMETVGQLTGGVAHDFNNLLTVIRSSTDLLKRQNLSEERRDRYIAAISDTVDRAARLTHQLLAFARRQALKPEVFAACDGVRMLGEMMKTLSGARIKLATDLPQARCFINADPSQFDTALVNMAVNARDAMDGQGRLTIRVEAIDVLPAVRTHPPVQAPYVAVSIADTGTGIAADKLDQIFEPFFTTKEVGKGTGLGLSQVFGFAKQSGGEVAVESALGQGTTFTLYLPRVANPGRKPARADDPDLPAEGHDTCVLLVEDNADVGSFSMQALIELGYLPILAANGDEAFAELVKDASRFDVVFSDVVMPGMNGIELGQQIRRAHPDLPVVLTSGYSHVLAQNGDHGFELLHKPYSIEQLSRVLNKVASWRRRQRSLNS